MCTNFLRPSQKTTVAMNMKMPGVPKARAGPERSNSSGMRIVENAEPTLIEK